MSARGDTIVIDLINVRSTEQLMDALGEALELGGPDGNVKASLPEDGRGWGKNWDALFDSLTCLDAGGIWGTSRRPRFPLRLELKNLSAYRTTDKNGFSVLLDVLDSARQRYADRGLDFAYGLEDDA